MSVARVEWRGLRCLPVVLVLLYASGLLGGCASHGEVDEQAKSDVYDPFEPFNRKMFGLNRAMDRVALKPLAKGYKKVMPAPVRRGFANVFSNFGAPRSALNNFLQGKPGRGFNELGRFLFNSTLGLGGIFDVASAGGMPRYDESFAETLAVWGVPEGPYLVLPFLGPQSALEASAFPVDFYTDVNTYLKTSVRDKLYLFRLLDARARLLSAETFIDKSNDPYIALRESYRQNRLFRVNNGETPAEEESYDDEMLENYYDEQ
jgi:phospholipid-binding lipoprotein MlaA